MIELELTIVRLTKTKEPVAVFDRVDCIFKLGFKTDEVANPTECEYADVEVLCDFEVFFKSKFESDCEDDEFFDKAQLHPNAPLITGLICGYRVEEIENPLTQKVRFLDKLVDELAKGKKMEKILRVG